MNVEHLIPDASALRAWRKSGYSGGGNGECLEVCDGHASGVPVRDSKDPHGPALVFGAAAWNAFVGYARAR
ncbi:MULTISPECIES: DUF397 domain-containing protein [unclassified Streptomyces]|uniref:DUF397 domain-containing protein n=1 Tax=unclassified Streptomyces TaxID=2593676 RepID=UPI002DDBC48B|nr:MULTISPECIES: DUF397 domain-containing protein [unclassified Streptomyces]WSA93898.1 DUF397 domain-containing protein [Streptomyces sp. NBC_01795]WSB78269.1 DUF397 domain-containing protein [Streptomyces sp. NBC_01775]WSS13474.1 DUF397 domain-containing protein [Streptomyces sp. NBC_01186]WSS42272.1 DUF397 domain-containing protein [Streptomyces sp. NBC_01187]